MDSSPVNPYLLFENADAFSPGEKVLYALRHPVGSKGRRGLRNPSQLNDGHYLIRSSEELRRVLNLPVVPNTLATLNERFLNSSYISSEPTRVPLFSEKAHNVPVEDIKSLENDPWDNVYSGTSVWRWPLEVLYQRYHLMIAIDFSFSTFSVSKNGRVLIDHVPCAIQALLDVIEKTLKTREQEEKEIRQYVAMHLEEPERSNVLRQVWKPQIDLSIVLINLPRMEMGELASVSPDLPATDEGTSYCADGLHPHLFPVDAVPFPTLEGCFYNDTLTRPLMIPLLTRCNAESVLKDESFILKLEEKLRAYEEACRSCLLDVWPERALFASVEHLVRLVPERSSDCISLVLLSNSDKCGSNKSLSLLESSVRKKNIILSILFLNETDPFYDSHTNAVSQFLLAVGGFGVHLDQWISMADLRLNIEWCQRFGGPRCLAQQIFVQLDNKFPLAVDYVPQNMLTTSPDLAGHCCALYDSDNLLEDFTLSSEGDVISALRCAAEARINQGWSVVMNHNAENPHSAHLHARLHCNLRHGKLSISYKMEISHPVVYRSVLVSGSKDLVEHFMKAKDDDKTVTLTRRETEAGWLVYLIILRSQLRGWMCAEQVALQCLLFSHQCRRPLLKEIQELSFSGGISEWWSSYCSVRSIGLFFRYGDGVLHFLDPSRGRSRGKMHSVTVLAREILGAVLKKSHLPLFQDRNDVFVSRGNSEMFPRYVIQVFLLDNEFANDHEGFLAVGFECRFSFFLTNVSKEIQILSDILTDIKAEVLDTQDITIGKRRFPLTLEASVSESNARALHLSFCAVSPRRLDLITNYIEPPPSGQNKVLSNGVINRKVGGARLLHPSIRISQGEEIRTIRQIIFRCFLTPYLVTPWILSDALAFHWMIGTADMWRTFAIPSFNIFVMRRVRNGFRLLHCMERRKAILYTARFCDDCHTVEIYDVIEAPSEGGDSGLPVQVIIYRYIRPFEIALSPLYRQQLTADISEDIQVATVLHTFKVLSSSTLNSAIERPLSCKELLGRGFVQLAPRLESLLPFLSSRHAHTITLHSLPSMGEKGDDDLREAVAFFVSTLGDRSATVDASVLHKSMREKVYGVHKATEDGCFDHNLHQKNQLLCSVLMPLKCNYLTFLLMPCCCVPNRTTLKTKKEVNVYVLSLDPATLFNGVIQLYAQSGEVEEVDEERLPDCSKILVLNVLTKLLTSFCSLYQAWQLLEQQRDGVKPQVSEEEKKGEEDIIAQDVLRTFSGFQDYCKEVDISYLLFVQESKLSDCVSRTFLHECLRSLITSMVRSMSLRPLLTHPAVFLPLKEGNQNVSDGITGDFSTSKKSSENLLLDSNSQPNPTVPPFLVRIALFFVAEDGKEEDCICVFSSEHTLDYFNDTTYSSTWTPMNLEMPHQSVQRRLLMRFFVKTAPKQLVDLSRNKYKPPQEVIRRIFGELMDNQQESNEVVGTKSPSLFFANESSVEELNLLSREALSFVELPSMVQHFFDDLASHFAKSVAYHCLTECLYSAPFKALQHSVLGESTNDKMDDSLPKESTGHDEAREEEYDDGDDDLTKETKCLRLLAHQSPDVLNTALNIFGLKDLLAFVVLPALLSDSCFLADSFTVEFTQQCSCSSTVNPAFALSHVFKRCLADDLVCVVPATPSSFLFVPNKNCFASRWILIYVNTETYNDAQRVCILFNEHEGNLDLCRKICKSLRRLIEMKVREVSQLHLLKQLRDTQNANEELIPSHWGDQFYSSPPPTKGGRGATSLQSAAFYCRGTIVLKLPIYYKLQHQCKKMLSRITSNCSRLELINVYNREQCFVVADDVQADTFHYIRLVFVKDTGHLPSLTVPSPSLSPADRCPLLVVQLFSATKNALVERPLRKLQEFCFFLAIQELQGYLNYVQHKLISTVDLIFLQHHRLDHVLVDLMSVGGVEELRQMDVQMAFALVVLGLKENKFKYFHVQDGGTTTISNFVEYYGLLEEVESEDESKTKRGEEGGKGGGGGNSTQLSSLREKEDTHKTSSLVPISILRFVKVIEGITDALVSCTLGITSESQLVVNRFLTKIPEERDTIGESEKTYLKEIENVVDDAMSQWSFCAFSNRSSVLSSNHVPCTVEKLLAYGAAVMSAESSTLRFGNFSLNRISYPVFPFLIESLVGVFEPFSPVCFLKRPNATPVHIAGFPWWWIEQMQRDSQVDQIEVYLTCGYHIVMGDKNLEECAAKPTRVIRETHQDLLISKATVLGQSPLLREHNIEVGIPTEPRVVACISLTNGVRAALFNFRDSDILLRLVGHVVARAEQQSDLLHDVMIQRMGFSVSSYLTEPVLARFCCGDDSNVTEGKLLCIHGETYRRRINHVRFPLESSANGDPLTIIIEGLFNRGLLVNGFFSEDDMIRVLYNESPQYSLKECRRIIQGLIKDELVEMGPKTNTRRLVNSSNIPDDALIGCDFRRHIQTAHILLESQHNTRSGIMETLQDCESFWNIKTLDGAMTLAKLVIHLQGQSKQIFGSRIHDFTLPRRSPWCLSDDILDQSLPSSGKLGSEYCSSVDETLKSYVQYVCRIFPMARVINLDADNPLVSSDATLLHRFHCRYGKVVLSEGNEIDFVPHLYYILIPIRDSKNPEEENLDNNVPISLKKNGMFILEIGFQVSFFALDVFMVTGESLSPSLAAHTPAWLKRNLIFSSLMYDLTVNRLLHYVQIYASLLYGQHLISGVLETLVKHYSHPPHESLNIVAVFDIEESCVRRARKIMSKKFSENPESNALIQLIPKRGDVLLREYTGETYNFCGIMVWETSRLFVLLSTTRDVTMCNRFSSNDLPRFALSAKKHLLQLLLDSMVQERLEYARDKLRAVAAERNDSTEDDHDDSDEMPSREDLRTLHAHWSRCRLTNIPKSFLQLRLDWKTLLTSSYSVLCAACLPDYSLHLILDDSVEKEDKTQSRDTNSSTIALTLAERHKDRECFVVVEFSCGLFGSIETAALYRGTSERGDVEKLLKEEEEAKLIEHALKLLCTAVWGHICY